MSIYLGVRCPVCGKKFGSADDIVVCPTCGAPHHRECYAQQGTCAFEADHLSGKVWQAPEPPPPVQPQAPPKTCPRCSATNPPENETCQVCGMRLFSQAPPREGASGGWQPPRPNAQGPGYGPGPAGGYGQGPGQPGAGYGYGVPGDPSVLMYGDLDPNEEIEGEAVRDLALYIGPNSAIYLSRFKQMSEGGRPVSLHSATLLLTFLTGLLTSFQLNFLYYFYRKMYLWGSILLVLSLGAMVPNFLYTYETFPDILRQTGMLEAFAQMGVAISVTREANAELASLYYNIMVICKGVLILLGFVLSLFTNRMYCRQAVNAVRRLREKSGEVRDEKAYVEALSAGGGTNKGAVAGLIVLTMGITFVVATIISYSILLF